MLIPIGVILSWWILLFVSHKGGPFENLESHFCPNELLSWANNNESAKGFSSTTPGESMQHVQQFKKERTEEFNLII